MQNRFPKTERLKSAEQIAALFKVGQSTLVHPVAVRFHFISQPEPELGPWQVAFVVSKKKHKLAVNRNRAKRQLKEAFRLHKQHLQIPKGYTLRALFIYVSSDYERYPKIEDAVLKIIHKLNNQLSP